MFRKAVLFLMMVLAAVSLIACGKQEVFACPFSDADWSLTAETLVEKEGEPGEIYASVYGGDTYTYPREYLGRSGTVKYMFSSDGHLASIAWAWVGESREELQNLFNEIDAAETALHGKSQFSAENPTSFGDVWYLKSGDILISTISGQSSSGLQYAYISRDYSKR